MTSIAIDMTDGLSSSAAIKGPCKVASTANLTLSGLQTVDGVAVVVADRVLVKDNTTLSENGIWVVDTGPWRRSKDFNKNRDVVKGTRVSVTSGSYANRQFAVTTADPISIGTSSILFAIADSAALREKLAADLTYYVRTDGSDSNDGLSNTSGGAFLTLSGAVNAIEGIDLNGFNVTIQVGNGTYTTGAVATGFPVGGMGGTPPITFRGDPATPSNVVISTTSSDCFVSQYGANIAVVGFRLQTTTSGGCMNAYGGGHISFEDVEFGDCVGPHKQASFGGKISNTGDYSIVGDAESHDHATTGGTILNFSATITLVGTPAFSAYYCGVNGAAAAQYTSITFVGSATGQRFVCHQSGSIYTGLNGWDYLPGSTAGGCYGGGSYDDSSQRFNNGAFPAQPIASGGTVAAGFTDAALGANVFGVFSYSNDANAPIQYSSKSRSGVIGTHGIALNGDLVSERRASASNGTAFLNGFYERIAVEGTFTSGATAAPMGYRISLSADESTAPAERFRIDRLGNPYFPTIGTTASAGNAFIDSGSTPANQVQRSTSSARFKRDIEDLDLTYSKKLLQARPVFYRSAIETDVQEHSHWGFIAEELAEIDPRLVHYGYKDDDWENIETETEHLDEAGNIVREIEVERRLKEGAVKVPDGVQYERFTVHLLALVKDLYAQVDDLKKKKTRQGI